MKWKEDFDKDLQDYLSRVDELVEQIRRDGKGHEHEVVAALTGTPGVPLNNELKALLIKIGDMKAKDHIALNEKVQKMPKLKDAVEENVKKPAETFQEQFVERFSRQLGLSEPEKGPVDVLAEKPEEPIPIELRRDPALPNVVCDKSCNQIKVGYNAFRRQILTLPEDHVKKQELRDWCADFGGQLLAHLGDTKKKVEESLELKKEAEALYVDANRRQMFMSIQERLAKQAQMMSKIKEVTAMTDNQKVHKELRARLDARPKIDS